MSNSAIILEATITPEGGLELVEKLTLPPGRVRLTLEPLSSPLSGGSGVLEVLERIHKAQRERGFQPCTAEEIDADVNALRDEWEERMQEIEHLQDQGQREREQRRADLP